MKRSLLVEENGFPLSIVIAGANRHDTKLLYATLDAIVVSGPAPTEEKPQHLCLDKGYDNPMTTRRAVRQHKRMATPLTYAGLVRRRKTRRERSATQHVGGWWNEPSHGCPSVERF